MLVICYEIYARITELVSMSLIGYGSSRETAHKILFAGSWQSLEDDAEVHRCWYYIYGDFTCAHFWANDNAAENGRGLFEITYMIVVANFV